MYTSDCPFSLFDMRMFRQFRLPRAIQLFLDLLHFIVLYWKRVNYSKSLKQLKTWYNQNQYLFLLTR